MDRNESATSPGQGTHYSTFEDVLTINYRRWDQLFTSVTGFYNYHYDQNYDFDQTPLTLLNVESPEKYHQFSQEFRVASTPGDHTFDYLAGAYFQTDVLDWSQAIGFFEFSPLIESIPPFAPLVPYLPLGSNTVYSQGEHSYSVFGSVDWHLTDRLKLTGGLRGSWVHKNYDLNYFTGTATQPYGGIVPFPAPVAPLAGFLPTGPAFTLSGSRADHAVMPSAHLQYQIAPDTMAYLSYARGFKAGGFNGGDSTGVAANVPYSPEYVNAYEAGLKSEWFDHRLLANLAVFRSEYSNLQVSTYEELVQGGPPIQVVRNAGASLSEGVDFEAKWVLSRLFRLSIDGEYLDAHYVRYPNGAATTMQLFEGLTFQNLAGAPTDYSPKWSAGIHADFTPVLPGGYRVTAELSPYATSRYYVGGGIGADPFSEVHAYARLDARVTFETADDHWALDVIGKNLTNRDIPLHFPALDIESKEQPRNVAAQIRYRW
jgi:outer membrane receptor protein involved in Fe transport